MKNTDLSIFLAESYGLQLMTLPQTSYSAESLFHYVKTPVGTFSKFNDFSDPLTPGVSNKFQNQVIFKLVTRGYIHIENRFGEIKIPDRTLSLMPWDAQFKESFTVPTSLYVIGCDQSFCQRILPLSQKNGGYSTQLSNQDFLYLTQLVDHFVARENELSPMLATISSQMIVSTFIEVLLNSEKVIHTKKISRTHNLSEIVSYIKKNLHLQDLSPEAISAHMKLSVNYMNRILAEEGLSLMKLVWKLRLEESKDLLTRPLTADMQISEIAWVCGFNSQSHFSQAFKKNYGLSPKEMRAKGPQ